MIRSEKRGSRCAGGGWSPARAVAGALLGGILLMGGAAGTWGQSTLRLDVFDKTLKANKAIPGWDAKKFSPIFGSGDKYFFQFVNKGPGQKYLHVQSGDNNSFSVGSERKIILSEWPVLEWEWKITKTPKGGDIRVKARDDQGGAVCIVIDPGLASFDSSLCYLFENDGPKNQPITSKKDDKAKYLILRTAKADQLGRWYKERRPIYSDYKRVFRREPTEAALIGIQIDSNDTESSAEAFYRKLVLHKK